MIVANNLWCNLLSFATLINTEIGQIPLPRNAVIPDDSFTSQDLKRAIDSHYMFIVANVKVNNLMFHFALIIHFCPSLLNIGWGAMRGWMRTSASCKDQGDDCKFPGCMPMCLCAHSWGCIAILLQCQLKTLTTSSLLCRFGVSHTVVKKFQKHRYLPLYYNMYKLAISRLSLITQRGRERKTEMKRMEIEMVMEALV